MPIHGPYSVETLSPEGQLEIKMPAVGTELMAITNATLYKRGAPHLTYIIKDSAGREIQRF